MAHPAILRGKGFECSGEDPIGNSACHSSPKVWTITRAHTNTRIRCNILIWMLCPRHKED